MSARRLASYVTPLIYMTNNKGDREYGIAMELGESIRRVGFDLYTTYHKTELSFKVFELLVTYFPDMGAFTAQNKKDLDTLRSYVEKDKREASRSRVFQDAEKAMKDILDDIQQNAHFAQGYETQNRQYCQDTFERCYIKIIYEFMHRSGYSATEFAILNGFAAIIYRKMAVLCTWFNDFAKAERYIHIASEYAQQSHDNKLITDINIWKQKLKQNMPVQRKINSSASSTINDSAKTTNDDNFGCGSLLFCLIFCGIGGAIAGPFGVVVAIVILIYLGSKK